MVVHARMRRCYSIRGRQHATDTADSPNSNGEQCPISDLETDGFDDSAFDQGKIDHIVLDHTP